MVGRKEGEEVRAEQVSISFANFDLIDLIYLAGFNYYILKRIMYTLIESTSDYRDERLQFVWSLTFFKGLYWNRILKYLENINVENSSTFRILDSSKFRLQLTSFFNSVFNLDASILSTISTAIFGSGVRSKSLRTDVKSLKVHFSYRVMVPGICICTLHLSDKFTVYMRLICSVPLSSMRMTNYSFYLSLWCICEWTSDDVRKSLYKCEGFQVANFSDGITCKWVLNKLIFWTFRIKRILWQRVRSTLNPPLRYFL